MSLLVSWHKQPTGVFAGPLAYYVLPREPRKSSLISLRGANPSECPPHYFKASEDLRHSKSLEGAIINLYPCANNSPCFSRLFFLLILLLLGPDSVFQTGHDVYESLAETPAGAGVAETS